MSAGTTTGASTSNAVFGIKSSSIEIQYNYNFIIIQYVSIKINKNFFRSTKDVSILQVLPSLSGQVRSGSSEGH